MNRLKTLNIYLADMFIAVKNYKAQNVDEIDLVKGEEVVVLEENYNGWWKVQ